MAKLTVTYPAQEAPKFVAEAQDPRGATDLILRGSRHLGIEFDGTADGGLALQVELARRGVEFTMFEFEGGCVTFDDGYGEMTLLKGVHVFSLSKCGRGWAIDSEERYDSWEAALQRYEKLALA